MGDTIEVRLFGPGSVRTREGVPVRHSEWRTVKNRDLFRLLCLRSDQVIPSEQVTEALWPEALPVRGRGSLRTAISQVRGLLGVAAIERVGTGLRAGAVWVDLQAYQSHVSAARRHLTDGATVEAIAAARAAVGLRTGMLIEDDPYSEWLEPIRTQVEILHGQFLDEVADAALEADRLRDALALGHAALTHDPTDEYAAQVIMSASSELGLRHLTRRVYATLCSSLTKELDAEPSPTTTALYHRLESNPTPRPAFTDSETDPERPGDSRRRGPITIHRAGEGMVVEPALLSIETEARMVIESAWPQRDLERINRFRDLVAGSDTLDLDAPTRSLAQMAVIDGGVRAGDVVHHLNLLWRLWPTLATHPDPEVPAHGALVLGYALHELDDPRFGAFWEVARDTTTGTAHEALWQVGSSIINLERGCHPAARSHLDRVPFEEIEGTRAEAWALLAQARLHEEDDSPDEAISTFRLALEAAERSEDLLVLPEIAARLAVLEARHDHETTGWYLALAEDTAGPFTWYPRERAWILLAQSFHHCDLDPDHGLQLASRATAAARTAKLRWTEAAIQRAISA